MFENTRFEKYYIEIWVWFYNRWINFWYRLGRCPVCKGKITWEREYEGIYDCDGYLVPNHNDKERDDYDKEEYCEGVC